MALYTFLCYSPHINLSTVSTLEMTLSEGLIRVYKLSVNTLQITNQAMLTTGKRF